MSKVKIYTDGSCKNKIGGWGAVILINDEIIEIFGKENNTTNNRMELLAAIKALMRLTDPCKIDMYTDSKYVIRGITGWIDRWIENGWKTSNKQTVKNVDLWQELYSLKDRHLRIKWHWIKGHSGNKFNQRADALARNAIK